MPNYRIFVIIIILGISVCPQALQAMFRWFFRQDSNTDQINKYTHIVCPTAKTGHQSQVPAEKMYKVID